MKNANVKELKDDAIIDIKVNKTYYLMVKSVLFNLFTVIQKEEPGKDFVETITKKPYNELTSDLQRSFHTITLLLAEIERKALEENMFIELMNK